MIVSRANSAIAPIAAQGGKEVKGSSRFPVRAAGDSIDGVTFPRERQALCR